MLYSKNRLILILAIFILAESVSAYGWDIANNSCSDSLGIFNGSYSVCYSGGYLGCIWGASDGKCYGIVNKSTSSNNIDLGFNATSFSTSCNNFAIQTRIKVCNISGSNDYFTIAMGHSNGTNCPIELKFTSPYMSVTNFGSSILNFNYPNNLTINGANCTEYFTLRFNGSWSNFSIYRDGTLVGTAYTAYNLVVYYSGQPYFRMYNNENFANQSVFVDYFKISNNASWNEDVFCYNSTMCPVGYYCSNESICVPENWSWYNESMRVLRVYVFDEFTSPLSNVSVTWFEPSTFMSGNGMTDADGLIDLFVPNTLVFLTAVKSGYDNAYATSPEYVNVVDMFMTAYSSNIFVNISSKTIGNESIPNAQIKVFRAEETPYGFEIKEMVDLFYTNISGEYAELKAGAYPLCLHIEAFKSGYTTNIGDNYSKCLNVGDYDSTLKAYILNLPILFLPTSGSINLGFKVDDALALTPLDGAMVIGDNKDTFDHVSGFTNASGLVYFTADVGSWVFKISLSGYAPKEVSGYYVKDTLETVLLMPSNLTNASLVSLTVNVTNDASSGISGAMVEFDCKLLDKKLAILWNISGSGYTNASGIFILSNILSDSVCDLKTSKALYEITYSTAFMDSNKTINVILLNYTTKYSLSGIVYDALYSSSPMPLTVKGAKLKAYPCTTPSSCLFNSSSWFSTTNTAGGYAFPELPAGNYLILISHPDYENLNESVYITSDRTKNFYMIPSAYTCDLQVTAFMVYDCNGTVNKSVLKDVEVIVYQSGESFTTGYTGLDGKVNLEVEGDYTYEVVGYYGSKISERIKVKSNCPAGASVELDFKGKCTTEITTETGEESIVSTLFQLVPQLLPLFIILFLINGMSKVFHKQ